MDRSIKKPIPPSKPKFKLQQVSEHSDVEIERNSNRLFQEAWQKQMRLNNQARSGNTLRNNKMPLSSISAPCNNSQQLQQSYHSTDQRLREELAAAISKRVERREALTSLTGDTPDGAVSSSIKVGTTDTMDKQTEKDEEIYVHPSMINQFLSSNYETFPGTQSEQLVDEIALEVDEIYDELQDITTDKKRWQVRRQSYQNPTVSDEDESWDSSEFEDSDIGEYDFIGFEDDRRIFEPVEFKQSVRNSIASMSFDDMKRSMRNTLTRTLDRQKHNKTERSKSQIWKEHIKEQRSLEDYYIDVKLSDAKHPPARLPDLIPSGLTLNQQKRRHIVESIVSTENSFVRSMAILINNYEIPLKQQIQSGKISVITSDQVKTLFYKIHAIHQCHRTFQIELADCAGKWDNEEKIASCFIAAFSRSLLIETYQAFVENFTKLQELLRELTKSAKKKKSFINFLNECHKASGDPLTFDGLIVKPIQRFPQFKMLLNDLLKYTPTDHPDRLDIQKAITVIESLAVHLNECKRDSEQKHEAKRILNALNLRIHPREVRDNVRLLSRTKVTKKIFGADGSITARKDQELLLFNNMLVAAENKSNEFDDSKIMLRWWKALSNVCIGRSSLTPDMKTRFMPSLNQTASSSFKDDKMAPEAKELCGQLQSLMHDFVLLTQINSTIATLRFSYDTINEEEIAKTTRDLQLAIQQKEEELRLIESSTLILLISKKKAQQPDKKQVIKQKTYVYELASAKEKQLWIEHFSRAKLSCRAINQSLWQFGTSPSSLPLQLSNKMPLLMKTLPVGLTRISDNIEVVCGVPVYLAFGNIVKRHLWCCNADGSVSIVSVYNETPQISEHFYCDEGYVLCAEVVPGRPEASKFVHQIDTVWHGTTDQRIVLHSLMEGQRHGILAVLEMDANVCAICYAQNSVYVGLDNGFILIYERSKSTQWNFTRTQSRQVGYGPVVKITYYRDYVYLACDNQIYVIDNEYNSEDHCRGVCGKSDKDTISDFTLYGHGIWISYNDSSIIRLWNLDLDVHLQEIDTGRVIETASQTFGSKEKYSSSNDCVTQMKATKNCLWIGMKSGWLCGLQLPGLEYGVPMGKGRPYVCSHAHRGPIRCIFTFQNIVERAVESITINFQSRSSLEQRFEFNKESILNKSLQKAYLQPEDNFNRYLSNPNLIEELNEEEDLSSEHDTDEETCDNHHPLESKEIQAEEEEYSALKTAVSEMNLIVSHENDDKKRHSRPTLFPCDVLPLTHFDTADYQTDNNNTKPLNRSIKRPSNIKKRSGNGANLVVTTGLGYIHYAGATGKIFKEISEACLMIWCE